MGRNNNEMWAWENWRVHISTISTLILRPCSPLPALCPPGTCELHFLGSLVTVVSLLPLCRPEQGCFRAAHLGSSVSSLKPDVMSYTSPISFTGPGVALGIGMEWNLSAHHWHNNGWHLWSTCFVPGTTGRDL